MAKENQTDSDIRGIEKRLEEVAALMSFEGDELHINFSGKDKWVALKDENGTVKVVDGKCTIDGQEVDFPGREVPVEINGKTYSMRAFGEGVYQQLYETQIVGIISGKNGKIHQEFSAAAITEALAKGANLKIIVPQTTLDYQPTPEEVAEGLEDDIIIKPFNPNLKTAIEAFQKKFPDRVLISVAKKEQDVAAKDQVTGVAAVPELQEEVAPAAVHREEGVRETELGSLLAAAIEDLNGDKQVTGTGKAVEKPQLTQATGVRV